MSFPTLVDANGVSFRGNNAVGGIFFYTSTAVILGIDTTDSSIEAWISPDGTTWTLTDAANHPSAGDGSSTILFRTVQDTVTSNLFYTVFAGNDDNWHVVTFDVLGNGTGTWGSAFTLGNPVAGGPQDIPTPNCLQISFRSTDIRVLVSVFGDDSGITGAEILAQYCEVDPGTGSQGAWITLPNTTPTDGSSWWTATVGMTEGSAGAVHFLINRATGGGGGTDFTKTYQVTLDSGGSFGSLTEVNELQSNEQGELLGIVFIDDFKSDGVNVYVTRSDPNQVYTNDNGMLVEGAGASASTISFSFQTITPVAATGDPLTSGIAIVPSGANYGLVFTDSTGLEYGEGTGPGVFVIFSTDDGMGGQWLELVVDTGGGFGSPSILSSSLSNIQGIRSNGPVRRAIIVFSSGTIQPQYIKRHNAPGH